MAFTPTSISRDILQGTSGLELNVYALIDVSPNMVAPSQGVEGSPVALISQGITALPTITSASSSGTTVTGVGTAFLTEVSVGDVIVDSDTPGSLREVVSITSDTVLDVDSAFSAPVAGTGLSKADTTYHIGKVQKLRPFQGVLHLDNSVNQEVPVSSEAAVVSLAE